MDELELEAIVDAIADEELRKSVGDYAEQDVDAVVHARMDAMVRDGILPEPLDVVEVGVDLADVGRNAFGVLHTAGGIVLSVFGAGQVAKNLEVAEAQAGLLPDWARTDASAGIPSAESAKASAPSGEQPSVFSKSVAPIRLPGYSKAEARIQLAQKKLAEVKAQPKREYTPISVNVPAFSFKGDKMAEDVVGEQIVGELASLGDDCACSVAGEYNVSSDIYLLGSDVLVGVAPKTIKKPGKPLPKKGKPSAFKKIPLGKSPHKMALGRALKRADRLDAVATTAMVRAAQYKPEQHKVIKPVVAVAVRGDDVILGAASLTPKQKAAIEKHQRAIDAHAKAVRNAVAAADKAKKVAGELRTKVAKYKPVIDKLLTATGPTIVLGDDPFEPQYEILGTGFVDYIGEDDGSVSDDQDIPLPVRGKPMSIDEAFGAFYSKVPESGIVADRDKFRFPVDNLIGSASTWFGAVPDGAPAPDGGIGSGFALHNDALYFSMGGKWYKANDAERANWAAAQRSSMAHNWGALIGNPKGPAPFMLYASEDNKFFWLPDNAPAFATKDQDQAIVDLNNKNREARRAEDAVRKAQQEKETTEQAEAQAKQDAANALAESAANSQEKVAQQANAAKQAELDLQQQKNDQDLAVQYAQQELRERQAMLEAGLLPGYSQEGDESGDSEDRGMPSEMQAEEDRGGEEGQAQPEQAPEESQE